MQGVRTAQQCPSPAPITSLWILDSWRDLVLYVCTPLLSVVFIAHKVVERGTVLSSSPPLAQWATTCRE